MAKNQDSSITTIDDAPPATVPVAATTLAVNNDRGVLSGERIELTINQTDGENGREPVFVGLDGIGYQIPRGVPVNVPVELLEILDNAVQTVYESTGTVARPREVKRYSYNTRAVKAA
jgi:hypothetical protein